jgi:DNA-binding LytR/AlgR family response regulator
MNKLTCIIIEDEPLAAEVLRDYIAEIPFLQLVATFPDALFALDALKEQSIDVIFLDIHLPKLMGLDFIKSLNQVPQIILTTAYHQYALESYDLAVKDYLLKPIEFSRFLKAINKLDKPKTEVLTDVKWTQKETNPSFRFFQANKKFVKIYLDEIIYIESLKDYVRIYTQKGQLVIRAQISELETSLKNEIDLLRIHRSYLVALNKIIAFSASEIELPIRKLPIGRSYKELVSQKLEQYHQKR